ncbi:hypothetical protein I0C86_28380 [Plantactinospora sp. S1510]|uniref:Uncharacterized protein n=1 Tax=Plantactinospora alkalitolerans TaxID=2789879 RepID=A0ABS0H2Y4_9ACTN|nr:hypothetical protein [Plantactinospora alkalitolerans]MBF9132845.1 hypothetical protein [Plantactinospora alkalitolerans]
MVDASIPFDYRQMHHSLNEIGTYLAELHYIDQVFAYMGDIESSSFEVLAEIAAAGFASGSWFTVEFTGTVSFSRTWCVPPPFPPRLIWQDSIEEEIQKQVEEYKAKAAGWASDNVDSIKSMVKPLAHPTGSVYSNDIVQPVRDALTRLEDFVPHDFGKLRHTLGNWSGEAAEDFATNFYNPFEQTLASHHRMLDALVTGLEAAHTTVDLTQQSLMNVLHATRDALLEQLHKRPQQAAAEQRDQSTKHAMIIVSAFVPMAKGRDLWANSLDMASAATSAVASGAASNPMDRHALTGGTAEELLHALTDAITLIDRNSNEQYEDLNELVTGALSRMESIRDAPDEEDGRLVPRQPRLLDGTNSSDFYLPRAR